MLGGFAPIRIKRNNIWMSSKPNQSIRLINQLIINLTIQALESLDNQTNVANRLARWIASEGLPRHDVEFTTFYFQSLGKVNFYLGWMMNFWQFFVVISGMLLFHKHSLDHVELRTYRHQRTVDYIIWHFILWTFLYLEAWSDRLLENLIRD